MEEVREPVFDENGHFVIADGTKINVQTGRPVKEEQSQELATPFDVDADPIPFAVPEVRRIDELPTQDTTRMNSLSVVAAYHMFGLPDADIAYMLGTQPQHVTAIRETDFFKEIVETIAKAVLANESGNIRTQIQKGARHAVKKVQQLVYSEDEGIALSASKDLLDRDGHRPADVVDHRHQIEGGLIIEHITKMDKTLELPPIELKVE